MDTVEGKPASIPFLSVVGASSAELPLVRSCWDSTVENVASLPLVASSYVADTAVVGTPCAVVVQVAAKMHTSLHADWESLPPK